VITQLQLINIIVITEMERIYCAVRIEYLNVLQVTLVLKSLLASSTYRFCVALIVDIWSTNQKCGLFSPT
jgi:hypothetical protein